VVATQNQPKPLDIACSAHTLTESDDVWQSAPGNMTISLTERIASPVAAGERSGIAMNENAGSGRAGNFLVFLCCACVCVGGGTLLLHLAQWCSATVVAA